MQATRIAARLHQLLDRVREEAQILDRVREEAACSPCHRPRLSSLQPTVVQGRRRARDVRASYSARSPTLLLHVAIPCIAQLAARKRRGPLLFPRVCRRNRPSGPDLDLARRIQPFACELRGRCRGWKSMSSLSSIGSALGPIRWAIVMIRWQRLEGFRAQH